MESGATAGRETTRLDALFEDAKAAVGYAANEVRSLTERAREVPDQRDPSGAVDEAAPLARQERLARLEAAVSSLERLWLFLGAETARSVPVADDDSLVALHAQDAERARIAQEIHDGPAQTLANVVFRVDIVERLLDRDPAAARDELAGLRRALDAELDQLRGVINQLRPRQLDELGLDGALREAALELGPGHEVEVDLAADADRLDQREQVVVLRIAQEALRNVRKHADAKRVRLATDDSGDSWSLEVADDGAGFEVQDTVRASAGRSFGLRFMRDRAASVGGLMTIVSGATGTRVRLTITPDGERSSSSW